MAEETAPLTAEEIVEAFKSNALTKLIFHRYDLAEDDQLKLFIELHNSKKIDLLSLIRSAEFQEIKPTSFFTGQHFYCEAIPSLTATAAEMMQCVDVLIGKGGADLAANQPNLAFRKWCEVDLRRAEAVIELAKRADQLACKFTSFALNAGNSVREATLFIERYTDERRLAAIAALGRMSYQDKASALLALSTLLITLDRSSDDNLNASILLSALEIANKVNEVRCSDVVEIIDRVCASPGAQVIFACARCLWLYAKFLDRAAVASLLKALLSVDLAHKGTMHELDNALRALVDTPCADQALAFLAQLLVEADGQLALADFQSFGPRFAEELGGRFQKTFASWMLSGKKVLCEGIVSLLRGEPRSKKPINLRIEECDLAPDDQIFLCRKVIGYLFLQPVIVASVLVSVLRVCTEPVANEVQGLFFEPLLRNYGGEIRDYLGSIEESDPAFPKVREALSQADRYVDDLKSIGNVKELHPSERQRRVQHIRAVDEMREIHKSAMKQSVFANLVRRSVILYGKRSISYVADPGGQRRPIEMELKSHSVSFEMPRTQVIDPVGLDFVLLVLRAEQRES